MDKRSGKLFEQMKEQVIEIILERGLKPHDPVPSEGELASRFGVSRMTGKLALQALQEEGIVYRLPRRGTFLADIEPDELRQLAGLKELGDEAPRRRTGNQIALIVPGIDDYIGRMITSIELAARRQELHVIIKVATDEAAEAEAIRSLSKQSDISGILLFPVDRKICGDHLLRLKLQKYPIVILDRQFNEIDFDSVSHDHYLGAYEMTSYLLELGHREIGFVTSQMAEVKSREERYQGYLDALMAAKVDIQPDRILFLDEGSESKGESSDSPAGKHLIQSFLRSKRKLTAVFCSDDYLAMSVMMSALQLGLRLPEDLSIAGFSNHSMLEFAPVRMTTVDQPMEQFGECAVRLLMNRLMNPDVKPSIMKLNTCKVLRDSTAAPVKLMV